MAVKKQLYMATWHPAATTRKDTKARVTRSFLLHVEKAVKIALGKKPDALPTIHYNPTGKESEEVFKRWEDGFACDIECPSLTDHRILSLAVSGDWDEAMVWDLEHPSTRKKLGPLKRRLLNGTRKVFHNGDFDIPILEKNGFPLNKESCWDTMIEASILFPDEPVNLSFCTSLATDVEAWKHLRGDRLLFYNSLDACYDWRVYLMADETYKEYET
jgi:hypothetical protein